MTKPTARNGYVARQATLRLAITTAVVASGMAVTVSAGVATAADAPDEAPTAGLAMGAARAWHSATLLEDGKVLVAGGSEADDVHSSAERFDPATQRFDATAPMDKPRAAHTATRLQDGRVLIIGGASRKARASIELFEPETGTFRRAGELGQARAMHTATLLDTGRVLIVGGSKLGAGTKPRATAELYDPSMERSTEAAPLKHGRSYHTATLLEDGSVLIVGGVSRRGRPLASAELYDPVSGGFERVASLDGARFHHTATRLHDGRVLIIGGGGRGEPPIGAELYDPVTQRFDIVAEIKVARTFHTSTLLADGSVLIVGGDELGSAELYDPQVRSFTSAGPLHSARLLHRATRLLDGSVLVTGGAGGAHQLDNAELYDPDPKGFVAFGPRTSTESEPSVEPSPASAPPLGKTIEGGRIRMTGSGFAMTFPKDWLVEVADPDPDVYSASPGTAWEALRAFAPDGESACSVAVGVARASLRNRSGMASGGSSDGPRWDERDKGTLRVSEPQIDQADFSLQAPRVRLGGSDPGLEHDVLYAISCSAAGRGDVDEAERGLEAITETFKLLSSRR